MPHIDDLLQPDNLNDNNKSSKSSLSNKKNDNTKSRLANLKELIKADPIQLNTDDLFPSRDDFPQNENIKYIDYIEETKKHKEFAEQSINNIVMTYVESNKLLNSPRLKDLKQNDILKYTRILLMLNISEANLLKLQESIDGGDMSKEMFDSVNKAQQELRSNMKALDEHLNKCENYWKKYSELYGFENEEEKIVHSSIVLENQEQTRTIVDISKLNELIQIQQLESKKNSEDNKK